MIETWQISILFFGCVLALATGVFVLRTSPLVQRNGGLSGQKWAEWLSLHLRAKLDDRGESDLVRLVRLVTLLTKYGVCVWGILNFEMLTTAFWTMFWVVLLVLTLLKKTAQFHAPEKWEHVSLKLDAEHFWLIHLILLGMAEIQIPSTTPFGLITLVVGYVIVNGESGPSLLASFEDVVRVSLGMLALWALVLPLAPNPNIVHFFTNMAGFFVLRGSIRAILVRDLLMR